MQEHEQGRRVIAYASRTNNVHERNLSAYEGELLTVVWATHKWDVYLAHTRFVVETDHASLVWLLTSPDLTPKLTRYALWMSAHSMILRHQPGRGNLVADALSRAPVASLGTNDPERLGEVGILMAVIRVMHCLGASSQELLSFLGAVVAAT